MLKNITKNDIKNNVVKKIRLQTVDHSARLSMKIAASCDKRCELQDTMSI